MPDRYRKLLFNFAFWLVTETVLNIAGLDTIANYSEFIYAPKNTMIVTNFNVTGYLPLPTS